jgi:hypothetical protein
MPTMQVNSGTRKQTASRPSSASKSLADGFNDLPFGLPDRDAGERGHGTMALVALRSGNAAVVSTAPRVSTAPVDGLTLLRVP